MSQASPPPLDEIMGVSFGEFIPTANAILGVFHVRCTVDGNLVEGERPPLAFAFSVLDTLHEAFPKFLADMAAAGIDQESPPSSRQLPAWNAGPELANATTIGLCSAFGLREPVPGNPAGVVLIGIEAMRPRRGPEFLTNYLVSRRGVLALQDAIAQVIPRIRARDFRSLSSPLPRAN